MANKSLFSSFKSLLRRADARNEAGGVAYSLPAKQALAQLAATGCFNGTFYADAADQLATLKTLIDQVDDNAFLAKLAVYSRERALMKDMPVALAVGAVEARYRLFRQVFARVVDNGRTLRTLGAIRAFGPVRTQELVARAAAGRSAMAEHRFG